MFDPEVRAAWLSEFHTENSNRDIDVPPIVSLLTPGVGLQFGNRDCGLFRFGVRPEFVLTPHCDDNDCGRVANHDDDANVGIKQWVVPEFLGEYRKTDWTFGVAYKRYGFQRCGFLENNSNFDVDVNTYSVYGKYKGFLLGCNFFSRSSNHLSSGQVVNPRTAIIFGYGYPF